MPTVEVREAAHQDLIEHFVYLADNARLDVADRFLVGAEETFADLARQPGIGAPMRFKHPVLVGVRKWRVNGFDNHLVFYEPRPAGVCIVRVIHAASDWWQLLALDD
jgi:toxin ParE1/3/4